ncbi:MAG: SGNH/GDSL hydrolase family protein [Bacteroidia bacterium]|nr:SGNH/GDSL hydrolase family protein [Bacteroidia bacterium]
MNLRYLLGSLISLPLLPLIYIQSLRIRAKVPQLPEAEESRGMQIKKSGSGQRILFLGESTVAGIGIKKHEDGIAGTFAREYSDYTGENVSWRVYAKSGYTAEEVYNQILPNIEESKVDLFVIGLGGNDAFTLNSPGNWIKNIEKIINHLQKKYPDTAIAFLNMPPIKLFPAFTPQIKFVLGNLVEILGDELEAYVAKRENVYYYAKRVSAEDWSERLGVEASAEDLFSDGVHPAKITYQLWAQDMLRYLVEETDFESRIRVIA